MKKAAPSIRNESSYKIDELDTYVAYTIDGVTTSSFRSTDGFRMKVAHRDGAPIFIVARGAMIARILPKHVRSWGGDVGHVETQP